MIVVGYSKRVSHLAVRPVVSIKEQNDRIREWARENGVSISGFYEDKGNDPDGDAGFQKMRIDGMNRRFDLVVLDSLFRCGKNFSHAKNLLYMTFYKLGIHFAVLEDGVNTMTMDEDAVRRYFRELHSRYAEDFELSQRLEKYQRDKQVQYNWERYGYLVSEDRSKIVVDEEAAKVIRYVFEQATKGVRKVDIVRELNRQHVETPSAHMNRVGHKKVGVSYEAWLPNAVRRILITKTYLGDDSAKETEGAAFPPIIDEELFQKANEKGFYHLDNARRYKDNFLFRRMVTDRATGVILQYREKVLDGKVTAYYHMPQDDDPVIEFEEVVSKVRQALAEEKRKAERVRNADENLRQELMERIDDERREEARELFERCLKAQEGNVETYQRFERGEISKDEYERIHGEIMERQEKVNREFSDLMREVRRRKEYLGKDNPWVRRFVKYDPGAALTCKITKATIRKIVVGPEKEVKVVFNEDGKEYLPTELLAEG